MNVDMHMKAVRRYGALIGDLDAPSQEGVRAGHRRP
jgi:hypothetical protein